MFDSILLKPKITASPIKIKDTRATVDEFSPIGASWIVVIK